MIISVCNEKGGSGKTTIATNLAFKLASEDIDLLLVDADPQGSVGDLVSFRNNNNNNLPIPFTSVAISGDTLGSEVKKIKNKFDSIIIDTRGSDTRDMRQAFLVADLAIVPTIPSGFDQAVLSRLLKTIAEITLVNENLKILLLISMASPNPFLKEKIDFLRDYLKEKKEICKNIKVADTIIYYREIYKNAVFEGKGVVELENNKAKDEINALYQEIIEFCSDKGEK
ncbi:AAA family ATPase [Campylobacter coli]